MPRILRRLMETVPHPDVKSWSIERWLLIVSTIATVSTLIFTAGGTYFRVLAAEQKQAKFEEAVPATYLRVDVYNAEQRRVSEALERLNRNFEAWQSKQAPATYSRMFDR